MPSKYPVCTSEDVFRALKKAGFWKVKQKGSHVKVTNGINIVIIPMHKEDLKTGTLKGILEQAGMSVEEFQKYL